MPVVNRLIRYVLRAVPQNSPSIYTWCKHYVDSYNGDNNDDISTNGELHFMQQVLPRAEMVFDVGANVGNWTALALKISGNLQIHCFEPSRQTYEKLIANKFPATVAYNNFGLSSAAGESDLFVFADGAGINSLYRREGLQSYGLATPELTETIRLRTLDSYCDQNGIERIDFLKVDVEGHELEVLKGGRRLLANGRIDVIQFEYGGCNIDAGVLLKDIFDFFAELQYSFFKIYPDEIRPVSLYDQRLENFQYQNWAVIRDGYQPA
jgi:FkbM family methyltransferase